MVDVDMGELGCSSGRKMGDTRGDGGVWSTGRLSVGLSTKAGIAGTGGGASRIGLAGGERYGMAEERERWWRSVGERGGEGVGRERDVDGGDGADRSGFSELRDGILFTARALWRRSPSDRASGRRRRGGGFKGMYGMSGDGRRGGGESARIVDKVVV